MLWHCIGKSTLAADSQSVFLFVLWAFLLSILSFPSYVPEGMGARDESILMIICNGYTLNSTSMACNVYANIRHVVVTRQLLNWAEHTFKIPQSLDYLFLVWEAPWRLEKVSVSDT